MVFEIKVKGEKWIIMAVYNPNKKYKSHLISYLTGTYEHALTEASEVICLGDLNIDMLSDECLKTKVLDVYGLHNVVKQNTCFKNNDSGTLLDPIFVCNEKRFHNVFNIPCGFSDFHNIVGVMTKCSLPKTGPRKIMYRSYRKFDDELFKKDIGNIPFHIAEIFDDEDDKYWTFQYLFSEVLNEHAPKKVKILRKPPVPYMNSKLRKEMYKRNMLKNAYFKNKTAQAWENYRRQRNVVTSIRRDSIRKYFNDKCSGDSNGKEFWKTIGPFMSDKNKSFSNCITLQNDNNIISNPKEVATIFNEFFTTKADSIGKPDTIPVKEQLNDDFEPSFEDISLKYENHESIKQIKEHARINENTSMFNFCNVTVQHVEKLLSTINIKKSTGPDDIPPKIIKLVAKEIAPHFTKIINDCMNNGKFPHELKIADVSPIFKKVNALLKENYRPVSILNALSKIFEHILAKQLGNFFDNIFDKLLCAYRKLYSCENVLVYVTDMWRKALDNNMFVGALLMDLSMAFDCLPHSLLIAKLMAYNVSESACTLLASYLTSRRQRVKVGDEKSQYMDLRKGIPQGSGLGPLIFNIFMNDIFFFIKHCFLINYADDNTITMYNENLTTVINALKYDANIAVNWFKYNHMKANPAKFQVIFLQPAWKKDVILPTYFDISDQNIEVSNDVKLLGINIDASLKFKNHIGILCKKAARQLNALKRIRVNLSEEERIKIFNTFILSNFNYCPTVWHFCGKEATMQMEKIQERALRFVLNDFNSSYETLLARVNGKTLLLSRIHKFCIEVYKTVHEYNPEFMSELITPKETMYDLRNQYCVLPNINTTTFGLHSFSYYAAHVYNHLQDEYKNVESVTCFKQLIKTWNGPKCLCNSCNYICLQTM
jgi:hypothetical protein